ncbi:MAG TPA: hypothetical protein PLD40_02570 [Kiritimatiellia bacterium]|jgi:hypothetical protein|nr:hypothetical protein [Kiritimatiellia bacterium]OQC59775.1 MAG: hypothetical protein BWX54_00482 [Verrucomicrobia bacterium ADurb.Bin018]MBP9572635.1 hypothetical protein [Kiritimatiellia bacterium]HOE00138.1 hypothetical protein [Kiritimatiellia bacterium]HOR75131.1 hypothetical protein [Kiritimatiellia bacterium]
MGILRILQKLGILRFGATAATYKNAKERPIELQMDGVFNAEKDLINPSDRGGAKPKDEPPAKTPPPSAPV